MERWVPIAELAKTVQIPESTVRRWLERFDMFFSYDQPGRGRRYELGLASRVLVRIQYLVQDEGFSLDETEIRLGEEFSRTVNSDEMPIASVEETLPWVRRDELKEFLKDVMTPVYEQNKAIIEQNQQIIEQNKALIEQQQQQKTRGVHLSDEDRKQLAERDDRIVNSLNEWREERLNEQQEKRPWWRFGRK